LKEKLLAAHRGGIDTVLIPHENEKDLVEIPENIKQDLKIISVRWIDEVLSMALQRMPETLPPLQVGVESECAVKQPSGNVITAH
ncbi:partial Lon protease, partial [Anaerolineae bacterium]